MNFEMYNFNGEKKWKSALQEHFDTKRNMRKTINSLRKSAYLN